MLKKRLIFTLLYHHGYFMLSRNFRLQKVGDMRWLQRNYDFSKISFSIDELLVVDASRGGRDPAAFSTALSELCKGCFMPVAAGGGVHTVDAAKVLLRAGADKVVVNSALYDDGAFIERLAAELGQQCIVASIDVKRGPDGFQAWSGNGKNALPGPASEWLARIANLPVGEIYLNSMDRDGTGQGYDLELLDQLPAGIVQPVILAGGAGNALHLGAGLRDARADAVATAHLFNFIGDGLARARHTLLETGVELAYWDMELLQSLHAPSEGAK